MKVELTNDDIKNLGVFLNRVKYVGLVEASAGLQIARALNAAHLGGATKKTLKDKKEKDKKEVNN